MHNYSILFVGIALLFGAALFQRRRTSGQSRLFTTRGIVQAIEPVPDAQDTTRLVTVSFQPGSGVPITFETHLSAQAVQRLAVGGEVTVQYDASNPERARLAPMVSSRTETIATIACLLVGACFFFYGLLLLMQY